MNRLRLTVMPIDMPSGPSLVFSIIICAVSIGASIGKNAHASAQETDRRALSSPEIHVLSGWARETVPGQRVGSAYLTFASASQWTFVNATSPVATSVELHNMTTEDGVMRMRKVDSLVVRPGAPTVLQPGGLHFMLHGLSTRLTRNTTLPLQISFRSKDGRLVTVATQVMVRPLSQGGQGRL